jgi:hypothetical protein
MGRRRGGREKQFLAGEDAVRVGEAGVEFQDERKELLRLGETHAGGSENAGEGLSGDHSVKSILILRGGGVPARSPGENDVCGGIVTGDVRGNQQAQEKKAAQAGGRSHLAALPESRR